MPLHKLKSWVSDIILDKQIVDIISWSRSPHDERFKITKEGGYAVRLINNTGASSVKGTLVSASGSIDEGFILQANEFDTIGVVYENNIPDGGMCWVVIAGITEVLIEDGTTATRSYWASASTVDGRALITTPPSGIGALSTSTHFKEIGHCIESKGSGTNVLAKVVLHFN